MSNYVKCSSTNLFVSMETKVSNQCPIRTTLELVGGKWRLLIIQNLREEQLRLSVLRSKIPEISEKMLIQELKHLVQSQLVYRKNFGEVPPRVEYGLTEAGEKVLPLIGHMETFADDYTKTLYRNAD